jgi:hypothetical protein
MLLAVGGFMLMLLAVNAGSAIAVWSAPKFLDAPGAWMPAVAVDARGDVVAAWETRGSAASSPTFRTSVHVVVQLADGKLIRRVLWSSRSVGAGYVSVAVGHGEVTVVWTGSDLNPRALPGGFSAETLRADYGPLVGRWAPAQTIGHWTVSSYPPAGFRPHLAVAPDGEVLLAWDDYSAPIDGPAVAWRAPGHRFGGPRTLARLSLAPNGLGPIPAFDAAGTAYVSGPCSGFVFTAPPHRHRFGRPLLVAPGQAHPPWMRLSSLGFNLSLAGAGRGLASWLRGECSFDAAAGNTYGPVFASVLHAGRFSAPLALSGSPDFGGTAAVAAGEGGTVSWVGSSVGPSSVHIGAGGLVSPITQATGPLVPIARDGGGDQLLAGVTTFSIMGGAPSLRAWPGQWPGDQSIGAPAGVQSLEVRPAGGGADQPAPTLSGLLATSAPFGRAFALMWNASPTSPGRTVALSVWRP